MSNVYRTPDSRFLDLVDFPFTPNYLKDLPGYAGLRMAYIDEGPTDGPVVLCLHGEPSWSYLYRKMIPVFVAAGYRVTAPDWFGFGRSDKPLDESVYTWDFHHGSMTAFVDALALRDITLVVQDWGGLLGLTLPITHPDLIKRLLIMNTGLAVGTPPGPGFMAWRDYVATTPDLAIGALISRSEPTLLAEEAAAYDAPFPDAASKAGVRRFPQLVPVDDTYAGVEQSRAAAAWWATQWAGESFMAIGVNDPVLGPPVMAMMRKIIRNCPEPLMVDSGHFVQEQGDVVAAAALASWADAYEH